MNLQSLRVRLFIVTRVFTYFIVFFGIKISIDWKNAVFQMDTHKKKLFWEGKKYVFKGKKRIFLVSKIICFLVRIKFFFCTGGASAFSFMPILHLGRYPSLTLKVRNTLFLRRQNINFFATNEKYFCVQNI